MKKRVAGVLMLVMVLGVIFVAGVVLVNLRNKERRDFQIVATNFPAYDFARAVVGAENVKMLIPPGAEMHDFEPTAGDIATIREADLFVYNGGESESFAEQLAGEGTRALKMMNEARLRSEQAGEYDEHIWTNPENAKKIVSAIAEKMGEIKPELATEYLENAARYNAKITEVSEKIRDIISEAGENGGLKPLIFGDRFPFSYFVDEYGLEYAAAFPGCAHEAEASPTAVAELIDLVRKTGSEVVLKLELSDGKIAETIAKETGAQVLTFHSAQTVSRDDFSGGKTYVQFLEDNLEVLGRVFEGEK